MLPIGITLGDPSGIGPEVALKALSATSQPAIIFGPSDLIKLDYIKAIIGDHDLIVLSDDAPISPLIDANWVWISTGSYALDDIHNHHSSTNGYHSYYAVELAMEAAKRKRISGLVTAPISKENWQLAGIDYIDHTTLLGTFFDREPTMAFYSSVLNVALVTVHAPLCEVPKLITGPLLKRTIQRCNSWLNDMGICNPKIAVAGLNPHAGESGFLGTEELEIIAPVIDSLKTEIPFLSGPYPADTLFIRPNRFDCVIAMYHDQGLAPLKALSFDSAVNVTLGLPIIRTSPDHGTAFDIAHTDRANPSSMLAAIQLANRLAHGS